MSKAVSRKAKAPNSTTRAKPVRVETSQPEWVIDMQRHFGAHGYYRPSDLDRVLGNPAGHTAGHALPEFAMNGKK